MAYWDVVWALPPGYLESQTSRHTIGMQACFWLFFNREHSHCKLVGRDLEYSRGSYKNARGVGDGFENRAVSISRGS